VSSLITPPRKRGIEILDDPDVKPELITRSMRDVARANALFGGRRAALAELAPVFETTRGSIQLLDVGTGLGDIPVAARKLARIAGTSLRTIGVDTSFPLVALQKKTTDSLVCGDGLALPFRDRSIDVVMASQILHHFPHADAVSFVKEMNRVARRRVVISDLRRSRIAAAGLWIGSFPLGFHPVSRHDGVVSVMRGFLPDELSEIVASATGMHPIVHRRLGFRLTTSWSPQ
jgi:2-polyprenyl-3-methyl-5-hydroxy-6-metoxy-1,4-benzoquinol methylase